MALDVVNENDFEKAVLKESKYVLVDFYADWCGPCKMIAPVLEQIAAERSDKLLVKKVNTDDNQQLASKYGVTALPTMLLFKDGKEVDKIVGAVSKQKILAVIDTHQ